MAGLDLSNVLEASCASTRKECLNCQKRFMALRPLLSAVVVTERFLRDFKDDPTAKAVVSEVLACFTVGYSELHQFEGTADGVLVFRAKKAGVHSVYVVDKKLRVIFLRAFRNFGEYGRFLADKKALKKMLLYV